MKPTVAVCKRKKDEDEVECTLRTLKMLPKPSIKAGEKVIVDINLLLDEDYRLGNITSPTTIEGMIIYLLEYLKLDPEDITVGDGGYPSQTKGAIKRIGLPELAAKYGFNYADFNDDGFVKVPVPNPLAIGKIRICKSAVEADSIISIPSLKTHSMAVTTLSIKNLMGLMTPRYSLHTSLHKKLADLLEILAPKLKLCVIDGFIGSDGMEEAGNPVYTDLCIAGIDPVAVDTVGSKIIGYTPDECKYLKYCAEKGLGTSDLDKINIIGESIDEVAVKFSR